MTAKNVDGAEGRFTDSDRSSPGDGSLKRGARLDQVRHTVIDEADEILDRVRISPAGSAVGRQDPRSSQRTRVNVQLFTQAISRFCEPTFAQSTAVGRTATLANHLVPSYGRATPTSNAGF